VRGARLAVGLGAQTAVVVGALRGVRRHLAFAFFLRQGSAL
jgi:hypothetical protein